MENIIIYSHGIKNNYLCVSDANDHHHGMMCAAYERIEFPWNAPCLVDFDEFRSPSPSLRDCKRIRYPIMDFAWRFTVHMYILHTCIWFLSSLQHMNFSAEYFEIEKNVRLYDLTQITFRMILASFQRSIFQHSQLTWNTIWRSIFTAWHINPPTHIQQQCN